MRPLYPLVLSTLLLTQASSAASSVNYLSGQLSNGLKYHIFQVPDAGKRLGLWLNIKSGSADENQGEEGVAHMLEHMMFQSSPNYPQGLSNALNADGWQMGRHYNAQTTYDFTRFRFTPPKGSRQLNEVLAIARQMLTPYPFASSDWQREQQVILAELRGQQGLKKSLNDQQRKALYSGARQSRYAIIGHREAIKQTQVPALQSFHNKWYVPNNTELLIISKLDPVSVQNSIANQFNSLPAVPLPVRPASEYEPQLQNGWHSTQIQDANNTESNLALIFRFPTPYYPPSTPQARRQRLLNNFSAFIINRRLQSSPVPVRVKTASLGKQTAALGLYATIETGNHAAMLKTLQNLRQQILQQPATSSEVAAYRKVLSETLAPAKFSNHLPNQIEDIIDLGQAVLQGTQVMMPSENAAAERAQLYRITTDQVNQRIQEQLNAADKLILVQAPGMQVVSLPHLADSATHGSTTPATTPIALAPAIAPLSGQGQIVDTQSDPINKVTTWKLSNGDRVVILQSPHAQGKIYFKAISAQGRLNSASAWQTQLAADTIWQAAPTGFTPNQYHTWQQQYRLNTDYTLGNNRQTINAEVPQQNLEQLLQLYRSKLTRPNSQWQAALNTQAKRLPLYQQSEPGRTQIALDQLHFGNDTYEAPNAAALRQISSSTLTQRWLQLNRAPTRYYLVTALPPEKIRTTIRHYLADLPRNRSQRTDVPPQSGNTIQHINIGHSDGIDIHAYSWQPLYRWTPAVNEQIPLLVNLANARLKAELRERQQSAYSVHLNTKIADSLGYIQTQLYFNTNRQRADSAWQTAQNILRDLPETLTRNEAANLRTLYIQQEQKKQRNPKALLQRLADSDQRYNDARYLSELKTIPDTFIQTRLRQTAKLLWSEPNSRVLMIEPE